MKLSSDIKNIIEHYINLIENNDWGTFYKKLPDVYDKDSIGDITEVLLESEIDPLEKLNYIPDYYLSNVGSNCRVKSFQVPDHIERIGERAFNFCDRLQSIWIPGLLKEIGSGAFRLCTNLKDIYFDGTKEQFKAIKKGNMIFSFDDQYIRIRCRDGTIFSK